MAKGLFTADSYYVRHCNPSLCYDSDEAVQTSFLTTFLCMTSLELCVRLTLISGLLNPKESKDKK